MTIAFDPSFTGESGGLPRCVASPGINTEDFQVAVDFLCVQENVDPEKIGMIGICGWGGLALNAAADTAPFLIKLEYSRTRDFLLSAQAGRFTSATALFLHKLRLHIPLGLAQKSKRNLTNPQAFFETLVIDTHLIKAHRPEAVNINACVQYTRIIFSDRPICGICMVVHRIQQSMYQKWSLYCCTLISVTNKKMRNRLLASVKKC